MRSAKTVHGRQRRAGFIALALTAAALVPAALAFACNPQAYLTLDRAGYAPGDSVRVSGSFFRENTAITVSIDRTGQSSTVTTSGNGSFATTFALPASAPAGGYTVSAIGYVNGEVIAGLPARASFSVAAPQSAPATAATPAPTPSASQQPAAAAAPQAQPAAPQASRPTAPQASRPTAPRPSAGGPAPAFREPTVFAEPGVQSSPAQRAATPGGAAARSDRATVGGRAVFGGSVAPAVTAPAATGSFATAAPTTSAAPVAGAPASRSTAARPGGARVSPQAAAQTAVEDVWSAQSSGRPSVLPVAGESVSVSSPRTGSQLTLALLLLGAGALALVGGLAASEARRRKVRAR